MLHFNPLLFVLSSVPQKKKCLSKAVYISVWYKLAKRVTDICVRFVPTQTGSGQNPITARFLAAVSPHATPIILMMFGWEKLLTTLSVFWLNWYGLQSIYIYVYVHIYMSLIGLVRHMYIQVYYFWLEYWAFVYFYALGCQSIINITDDI